MFHKHRKRRGTTRGNKMTKHSISFQVEGYELNEFALMDLIRTAVLPALSLELVPVTFEVKKARK